MAFTHVQGNEGGHVIFAGPFTVALGANPTTGNLVCVGISFGNAPTGVTVKDGNNNPYTLTPKSGTGNGVVYLAYILSAPVNADKNITVSWTGNSEISFWVEEFGVSGGTASFDKDAIAAGGPSTAINTPSITPAQANELLWATAVAQNVQTAPTAGGTAGVWTGAAGGIDATSGNMSEYDLSASSATAVNFTQSTSGTWNAMSAAFILTAIGDDSWTVSQPSPVETNVSLW